MKIKFGRSWGRHLRRNKAYNKRFSLKHRSYRTSWLNPKTPSELGINYHKEYRGYF